jgi:peptide/nickel transport system permease protein
MTTETIPAQGAIGAAKAPEWTMRELSRWERLLGPETYRLIRGVFINPLSVAGLIIVVAFILVAALAPTLAPKVRPNADPYLIPRDGFGPQPQAPGSR